MDARQNITGGVRYLAELKTLFPGRVDLQLAGYHAGAGAVKAAGGQVPDTTDGKTRTPQYVQEILAKYEAARGGASARTASPPAGAPAMSPPDASMVRTAMEAPAPPAMALSAVPAGESPRGPAFVDQMPARAQPWTLALAGEQAARGMVAGTGAVLQTLSNIPLLAQQMGESLAQATGLPSGGALVGPLTTALQTLGAQLTSDPQLAEDAQTFSGALAQAVGQAIPGLGTALVASSLGGPVVGLGVLGAVEHAQQDVPAMATGAATNMLLGAFLHATNGLPGAARVPLAGATFAGLTAAQTQDMQQATIQGLIGAGLALPASAKRALETQPGPLQDFLTQERQAHPTVTLDAVLQAAQSPTTPVAGVDQPTWQRWAQKILDLLPEPSTAPLRGAGLGSERGNLDLFGPPEPPPRVPQPTLRAGAEGLTPARYKTPGGTWRIPLRDMPPHELELLDFLRQPKPGAPQGGMKLQGEELAGEFERYLRSKESGEYRLLNDGSGLSVQAMAEAGHEAGFLPTADKEALLEALDRSVSLGQPVYSQYATGTVPLLDDPHVQGAYRAVLEAIDAMQPKTDEQVGGVRGRQERHAEAAAWIESGQYTLDDVRELYPNTVLDDTQASALLQSVHAVGVEVGKAAIAYVESGARIGSREEASLQQAMALLAELDPYRLGVSAAQSRALGILNDPLSGYTQYLNRLHAVLAGAPEHTMEQIATKLAAAQRAAERGGLPEGMPAAQDTAYWKAHPDELDALFQDLRDFIANQAPMPFRLQAEPDALPFQARTPEEQALIDAAFTSERAALTPKEWAARERDRGFAHARMAEREADLQWRNDVRAFEALQAERQASTTQWEPAPMDAALLRRLDLALRPWGRAQPQLLMKALVQSVRPGFEGYFLELMYNAQLSNWATHLANIAGNTVSTVWAFPERFIAAQNGTPGGVARGEATAMLYGLTHGIADAWTIAARSFREGQALSGMSKGELRQPAMTAANVGLDPASSMGRLFDFWAEYIGIGSGGRLPTRALMAADEFSKMLNYRMELNAQAYREATRLGYDGTAWAEHVQRVVSSPTLAVLEQAARDFSIVQTFQQTLEPFQFGTDQGRTLGGAVMALSNVTAGGFPVGRLVLPYVQTPANIAKYALERTPAGFFFASVQADLDAGGARGDIARAKVHLGVLTMVGMAGLAMSGYLVGRAPDDPELRRIFLDQHPEYSVYVPGVQRWVGLDRLEPIGMLATYIGDAVQIAGEVDQPTYQRGIAMLLYPFLKDITSKTYMRGLSDFFDATSPHPGKDPEQTTDRLGRYLQRQLASLGQPSALLAATARAIDPVEKDIKTLWDAWYSRVPGHGDIPARRSLDGSKILSGTGLEPGLLANLVRAYNPFKLGDGQVSPADAEIQANFMTIPPLPRALITRALRPDEAVAVEREFDLHAAKPLTLTPREYERYSVLAGGNQERARELGLQLPSQALRPLVEALAAPYTGTPPSALLDVGQFLDWMITTPEYRAATEGAGGGREDAFKEVVGAYRQLAKTLLLYQDDALRGRYEGTEQIHALKKLPLGQRPGVQQEMQQQYREAVPAIRQELGLQIGVIP
jgi:hypothetical protein